MCDITLYVYTVYSVQEKNVAQKSSIIYSDPRCSQKHNAVQYIKVTPALVKKNSISRTGN